jgi:hypothetical protein
LSAGRGRSMMCPGRLRQNDRLKGDIRLARMRAVMAGVDSTAEGANCERFLFKVPLKCIGSLQSEIRVKPVNYRASEI